MKVLKESYTYTKDEIYAYIEELQQNVDNLRHSLYAIEIAAGDIKYIKNDIAVALMDFSEFVEDDINDIMEDIDSHFEPEIEEEEE